MIHHYPVQVAWSGGRAGSGTIALEKGGQPVSLAVPTEFQGSGAGTSPEELLASAVAGCYAVTLGIVAEHRNVPIAQVDVTATGEVRQDGTKLTYTAITLRPRVQMEAGATEEQARQALDIAHRADKYCVITNAVRGSIQVSVEPEIVRA
jgi:peroxiredoxin-like protein